MLTDDFYFQYPGRICYSFSVNIFFDRNKQKTSMTPSQEAQCILIIFVDANRTMNQVLLLLFDYLSIVNEFI